MSAMNLFYLAYASAASVVLFGLILPNESLVVGGITWAVLFGIVHAIVAAIQKKK